MKEIKIIDLLNMVAEGKEVPKFKFKKRNSIWKYNPLYFQFQSKDSSLCLDIMPVLNEEVEIIEEDIPQPEDVLSFTLTDKVWTPRQARELIENFRKISEKLKRKKDNNKIEEINNAYYHETQDRINEIFKNKINDIIDKINNME